MSYHLPATRVAVPNGEWRVSSIQQLQTSRGVAFFAKVRRHGKVVGEFENRGDGGATRIEFDSRQDVADWEAWANQFNSAIDPDDHFAPDAVEVLIQEFERKAQLDRAYDKHNVYAIDGDVTAVKFGRHGGAPPAGAWQWSKPNGAWLLDGKLAPAV